MNDKLLAVINQLLDLGKRNRLLNYRDQGLKTLKIQNKNVEEIFRGIKDHKEYTFFNADSIVSQNNLTYDIESKESVKAFDEALYSLVGNELDKRELLCYKKGYSIDKVLKGLMKEHKQAITEKGINSLYLSFCFIHYFEGEEEFLAPLLLIPAELDNETGEYILNQYEDEVLLNPTLKYYFKTLYDVELVDYNNDALSTYVEKIRAILPPTVTVELAVALGIYSFYKMNMYNDLKNNQDIVLQNNNIKALLGNRSALDEKLVSAEIYPVVNCDSSQLNAIELAAKGKSFCLQGPPGSGKSQTITNIISSMLGNGKKILFVSEKIAALNVVYENLRRARLSEFAIELHSNKANKKEFIANLYRTATLPKYDVDFKTRFTQAKYLQLKSNLRDYESRLHQYIPELGVALADLYSMYLNCEAELIDYHINDENINLYSVDDIVKAFNEYIHYSKLIDLYDYRTNAFYDMSNIDDSYITYHFYSDIDGSIELFKLLIDFKNRMNKVSNINVDSVINATKMIDLVNRLVNLKTFNKAYLDSKNRTKLIDAITNSFNYNKGLDTSIFDIYDKSIIKEDLDSMLINYKNLNQGIFKSKEFKELNEKILSYRKSKAKPNEIIEELQKLSKAKKGILMGATITSNITKILGSISNLDLKQVLLDIKSLEGSIDIDLSVEEYNNIVLEFKNNVIDFNKVKKGNISLASLSKIFYIKKYNIFELPLDEVYEKIKHISVDRGTASVYMSMKKTLDVFKKYECLDYLNYYLDNKLPIEDVGLVYKKRYLKQKIDAIVSSSNLLKGFESINADEVIESFSELDEKLLNINRDYIIAINSQKRPNEATIEGSQFKILDREFNKKTRQLPIRSLLEQTFELALDIKPVFLMSPLSVSTYLANKLNMFDCVIFDEASQIFASDALGAIYRAKQCIVIGDTKQMPPTSFFQADFGVDDKEYDLESILDKASYTFDMTSLKWHYRSRSEELITFSNKSFYDSNLITIPQSKTHEKGFGIDFVYVEDGIYDATSRTNQIEAKKVCDLVFEHFDNSNKSLGVVAFSNVQAELISNLVERRRAKEPKYERFFSTDVDEPFFVKNLETVQGDERDRIIFSICYGYNTEGKFYQRFGPLNNQGGERRLNVAITRAKYNITVTSSIRANDIRCDSDSPLGVVLLKEYLDFANNVDTIKNYTESDNGVINSVCKYLNSIGYDTYPNYGSSSFKVDIAVKKNDDFIMAIMIDGKGTNKSDLTDKYRLEKLLLERLGWRYFKLYSPAWIKNQKEEEKRIKEALDSDVKVEREHKIDDTSYLLEDVSESSLEYLFDEYNALNLELETEYLRMYDLKYLIREIIKREAPIHEEYLMKRIALVFEKEKANTQLREEILDNIPRDVYKSGDFYIFDPKADIKFRIKGDRDPQFVHPLEYYDGIYNIVLKNKGINVDGCFRTVAQLLNQDKLSANLRKSCESALADLKHDDKVYQKQELLFANVDKSGLRNLSKK